MSDHRPIQTEATFSDFGGLIGDFSIEWLVSRVVDSPRQIPSHLISVQLFHRKRGSGYSLCLSLGRRYSLIYVR